MKVLVTGAAGFIGSHLADRLLERGDEVIALDNFNNYYDPARKERNILWACKQSGYTLHRADLRDYEALETLFKRERPDKICHLAGMAGVRYSVQQPLLYEEVNIRGTLNLLELMRLNGVQQMVMASSSSVYGHSQEIPFKESARLDHPIHPYAATKRAAELLAYTHHYLYQLQITALRFFTVYGPRVRPDMAFFLFTDAIANGQPIKLFGDGSARRDWTYVDDTVNGVIAALDRPQDYAIINLGNTHPQAEMDLIHAAEAATGKTALINHVPRPASEPLVTYSDISVARDLLDFNPVVPFAEGYAKFYDWYVREGRTA